MGKILDIENKIWWRIQKHREEKRVRMMKSYVLMFHDISVSRDDFSVSEEKFCEIIQTLINNGYSFGSLDQLCDGNLDTPKTCYITFDDGYQSVLTILPLLKKYEIPFCVYITTSKMGKKGYLSPDDVKSLSKEVLCTIGNHTDSHVKARNMSQADFVDDVMKANNLLERITLRPVNHFAFPYGSIVAVSPLNILQLIRLKKFRSIATTFQDCLRNVRLRPIILPRIDASRIDVLDIL